MSSWMFGECIFKYREAVYAVASNTGLRSEPSLFSSWNEPCETGAKALSLTSLRPSPNIRLGCYMCLGLGLGQIELMFKR